MKKPSDFISHPYDSIFQNNEFKTVARNIMVILKETGNIFRELSWEEYSTQRKIDGGFSIIEKQYFDKVKEYCFSSENARSFSPAWKH